MNLPKKSFQVLFIISFSFLSSTYAQLNTKRILTDIDSNKKLEITGTISGLQEGEPLYLLQFNYPFTQKSWVLIDTAYVKGEKFSFEYRLTDGPRLFMISFPKHKKIAIVTLGNEKINISSKLMIDEMPKQTIFEYLKFSGSDLANDFLYLSGIDRLWLSSLSAINTQIHSYRDSSLSKENLERILTLMQSKSLINNSIQFLFTYDFFSKRNDGVCELFTECPDPDRKYDSLWIKVFNNLDDETRNSYYGKILKENIRLCVGQVAPDFQIASDKGESNSMKKIVEKNKLTILHFWSNESPERQTIHNELMSIYKKYHGKRLEIINVSLDSNPDKWKRIIKEDNLLGYHSCDLKEEEGEAAINYKIRPKDIVNILIDQSGKIIAWDLDGPQLYALMYKLFGD